MTHAPNFEYEETFSFDVPLHFFGSASRVLRFAFSSAAVPFNEGVWNFVYEGTHTGHISIQWAGLSPATQELIEHLDMRVGGMYGLPSWTGGASGVLGRADREFKAGESYELAVKVKLFANDSQHVKTRNSITASEFLKTPLPNDVEFIFPRAGGGRSLWANSRVLTYFSPYFKTLLASGFSESSEDTSFMSNDPSSFEPLPFDDSDDSDGDEYPAPTKHFPNFPHKRITVTQTSFKVYHAVPSYIFTGHISFKSLPSSANLTNSPQGDPTEPLPSSPKSVYRLAHLLEIPAVQTLALDALKTTLSPTNIAAELFSETSGTYDEVLEVLVDYAVLHRADARQTKEWKDVLATCLELPWGGKVLARLAAKAY
ncbi:hypothetical protein P7C70_g3135, partial [Phenoliferia sp. Uapishka_3]